MTEIRQFINLANDVIPELAARLGVHLPEPASDRGSEPASEPESFARIYEQCMSETESSHAWHLKNE